MATKIYAYKGLNHVSQDFPVSHSGSITVVFSGGNIHDRKDYRMATTKAITDPVVQEIIEHSPLFGSKVILAQVIEDTKPSVSASNMKEYPDVTNFAEACSFLKSEFQVKASLLRSPNGVRNLANSMNISFPNWND